MEPVFVFLPRLLQLRARRRSCRKTRSDYSYCSKPILQHQFSATRIRTQAIGLGVCPEAGAQRFRNGK